MPRKSYGGMGSFLGVLGLFAARPVPRLFRFGQGQACQRNRRGNPSILGFIYIRSTAWRREAKIILRLCRFFVDAT